MQKKSSQAKGASNLFFRLTEERNRGVGFATTLPTFSVASQSKGSPSEWSTVNFCLSVCVNWIYLVSEVVQRPSSRARDQTKNGRPTKIISSREWLSCNGGLRAARLPWLRAIRFLASYSAGGQITILSTKTKSLSRDGKQNARKTSISVFETAEPG